MKVDLKNVLIVCLVVLLLALHVALSANLSARWSPNIDEPAHLAGGVAMWQYGKLEIYCVNPPLVRGVVALPALLMPHEQVWADFDAAPEPRPEFVLGEQFVQSHPLDWRRFLIAGRWTLLPFSILGGLFCYFWAAELFGRKAGLMALSLWCFSPNIRTWSSLICTDMPAAAMAVGASYFFWRWLKQPTWGRAALAGGVLGLAQLCKMTCLVLFVVWSALWMLWRSAGARNRAEQSPFVKLAAILLIGLYVLNLGYAFDGSFTFLDEFNFHSRLLGGAGSPGGDSSQGNRFRGSVLQWLPIPLPMQYVRGMDLQRADFEEGEASYLFGEWSDRGWWYYYLVGLGLKIPLGTWGLGVVAAAVGCSSRWRRREVGASSASPEDKGPGAVDQVIVLVPALAVLALVSSQDGISRHFRYVLPVLPFGFVWISQVANQIGWNKIASSAVVLVSFGWSLVSSMAVYPHTMSYFNELAGGPTKGHFCMLGSSFSWSQDHFYLRKWIQAHPEVDSPYMLLERSVSLERLGIRSRGAPPPSNSVQGGKNARGRQTLGPIPGWHVMSVQSIHQPDGGYLYFRDFEPVATVGHSINVYHIGLDDSNQVRRTMGLPEISQQHIRPGQLLDDMVAARDASGFLRVALFAASELGRSSQTGIQTTIEGEQDLLLTLVSEDEIRNSALKKYDVIVVPGAKATIQGSALGTEGRSAIQDFVRGGGGYVGVCAGAYLAAVNHDWSLKLINARTIAGERYVPSHGRVSASFRGWGTVSVELTDDGCRLFRSRPRRFQLDYTGGPVFSRANEPNLPDYEPLAYFRSEVWKYAFQKGTMVDSPAILAAQFGRGKAILFSPHPETTHEYEHLLTQAIRVSARPRGRN